MAEGDPLALHGVDPHGSRVEEQVDDVILQQVHLVHVEEVAMGVGQEPRLEPLLPAGDGVLEIRGADQPIPG